MDSFDFAGTDRFQVVRPLGSGGMGAVYAVFDRDRGVHLALKRLHGTDGDALIRLKTEFRSLRDVTHPNLVSLGELVEENGQWFFTMELIEGEDFLSYVRLDAPADASRTTDRQQSPSTTIRDDVTAEVSTGGGLLAIPSAPRPKVAAGFDEARLRQALRELAAGLAALHASGKAHLDIKPSNALVTSAGRAVLLDFGLVRDIHPGPRPERVVMGTPSYMAPEQLLGKDVGGAADWYSVGVLLYEALTGMRPTKAESRVLMSEQELPVLPPSAHVDGVPQDLDALTLDLLRLSPFDRPDEREILERIGVRGERRRMHRQAHRGDATFTGRERELRTLDDALSRSLSGAGTTFVVQGESGLGKTSLVERFVERAALRHDRLLVLAGRCHARESVPFRALDGVIDGLLLDAPEEADRALEALTAEERTLAEFAFPVLRRSGAKQPSVLPARLDAPEQRRRMFLAMRAFFGHLARSVPVLVTIDDLQWADADSLALLRELLRAPRPPLFLVATVRSVEQQPWTPPLPEALGPEVEHLLLQPLPPEEGAALARALIDETGAVASWSEQLALEAGGHPLFIRELARSARARDGQKLALESVLRSRIRGIDDVQRRVLGLLSLSLSPLHNEVLRKAVGVHSEDYARSLRLLQDMQLVRAAGLRRTDLVEPYHDRIRQAMLLELPTSEAAEGHRGLAMALETTVAPDVAALATHWQEAGERTKALGYAQTAAAEAEKALAFERAATLLGWCIELLPDDPERSAERVELFRRMGDAYSSVGRGKAAAGAYLAALPFASPFDRVELQRVAGMQLLFSGHHEEGVDTLRSAVLAAGMSWPETTAARVGVIFARRMARRIRPEPKPRTLSPEELQQLDLCWALVLGVSLSNAILGAAFKAEHLARVFHCDDPMRRLQAFTVEYTFGIAEHQRETEEGRGFLARARALAEQIGTAEAEGFVDAFESFALLMLAKDFQKTRDLANRAEGLLEQGMRGRHWEINNARHFHNQALMYLGEWATLRERADRQYAAARARGDFIAAANLSCGVGTIALLSVDEVEIAEQRLADTRNRYPKGRFQHIPLRLGEVISRISLDLYKGDLDSAKAQSRVIWRDVGGNLFIRSQMLRFVCNELIGRTALAAATASEGTERKVQLRNARGAARALRKLGSAAADAVALYLEAGIAAFDRPREEVVGMLKEAEQAFAQEHLAMYAAGLRAQRGRLLGEAGRSLTDEALEWIGRQAQRPDRIVAMLTPFPAQPHGPRVEHTTG